MKPSAYVVVDVVGIDAGVYDRLVELGLPVTPYNGGEAPYDNERLLEPAGDLRERRNRHRRAR
jgi:hypothetical protein